MDARSKTAIGLNEYAHKVEASAIERMRTKTREELIQDGTVDSLEWEIIIQHHRDQEKYARQVARTILSRIEERRVALEPAYGFKRAIKEIVKDYLVGTVATMVLETTCREKYQVDPDHINLVLDLVQEVGKIKYGAMLEGINKLG